MPKRAASRAQIRCRRGKRPRLVHDPSRPACEAQIRSRGIKRKSHVLRACSSTAQTNNSWGSKRVRTALRSTTTRGLSVRPLTPYPKLWWRSVHLLLLFSSPKALSGLNSSWGRRDWSNIGVDGPACLIAELVLANDVADYIRFRAVCPPWRRSSLEPRLGGGLDGRFLPRRWIMLDKAIATSPCCYRLLNVSTGEVIQTDLPELAEHKLLALTPEGLLLLLHEPTLLARLLNPLTRQLTDLPPVTALLTPEQQRVWRSGVGLGDTIWVCGAGLADASTVAVCFCRPKVTAIAKPGDECWTVVDNRYIDSTLPFAGRFYCTVGRSVMVLDNSASDQGLVTADQHSKLLKFVRMSGSLHLVDNGGELMLVHRMLRPSNDPQGDKYKMEYEVYRVDLDARELVLVKSLGGRAVFIGRNRAISISAEAFPSISADTLYLGFDCDEKTTMNQIDGYNVMEAASHATTFHALIWSTRIAWSTASHTTSKASVSILPELIHPWWFGTAI